MLAIGMIDLILPQMVSRILILRVVAEEWMRGSLVNPPAYCWIVRIIGFGFLRRSTATILGGVRRSTSAIRGVVPDTHPPPRPVIIGLDPIIQWKNTAATAADLSIETSSRPRDSRGIVPV